MDSSNGSVVKLVSAYYEAVGKKNIPAVANLLHPDVSLTGPLGNAKGKAAVLQAVTGFATLLKSLRVKAAFTSEDQAMVNYDVDFGEPFGLCRSAALLWLRDDAIVGIELFFDARPFEDNTAKGTSVS